MACPLKMAGPFNLESRQLISVISEKNRHFELCGKGAARRHATPLRNAVSARSSPVRKRGNVGPIGRGKLQSPVDRVISYVRAHGDFRVFADIRTKPRIYFYVYEFPRDSKMATASHLSFTLGDQLSRNLGEKWQAEFEALIARSKL